MFVTKPTDKALFIYNPNSGKRIIEKNIEYIKRTLYLKFNTVDIVKSKSADHFKNVIKEACKKYDYVFFSGGDGTCNMAFNSIPMGLLKYPIFGYLPGGTTCDMSKNTNISKNPKKGIYDLINGTVKDFSVGTIGDKRFVYVCVCGGLINVSHLTTTESKAKYGNLAYVISFFKYLNVIKDMHKITIDGVKYETPFVLITNGTQVATVKVADAKQVGVEKYNLVVVKKGFMFGLFNFLYLIKNGFDKAKDKGKIYYFNETEYRISCDTSEWDTDGERCMIDYPAIIGFSGLKIKMIVNRD